MRQDQLKAMFNTFGFCRRIDRTYEDAVATTTAALQTAGFKIITSVDMQFLAKENEPHTILEVWDPILPSSVLRESPQLSLFLPFNVAVLGNDDGGSTICMPDPIQLLPPLGNGKIKEIADDLNRRIWGAYLHVVIKQPQPVS
jgi:uncharacterized protein (DUF302 family)